MKHLFADKKQWLLLLAFLPAFLTSCGDDENDVYEGYRGSSDMTMNLQVDWGQAATKSVSQLVTQFLPAGNTFLGKEISWTEEDPTIRFVAQNSDNVDVLSQLNALEVLIDNYSRTKDESVLNAIETVLQTVYSKNRNSYVNATDNAETAATGLVLVRLYEATQESTYWNAAKEVFTVLEKAGESSIEVTDAEIAYTNGRYGIPTSATDGKRTIAGNAMAAIMAMNMYAIANASGENDVEKYRDFGNNIMLFCESSLYESSGLVYTSTDITETGSTTNQDRSYSSANQGYLLGVCVTAYNMDQSTASLEYANTIATYQVMGTNNNNVWHQNYAVFYPSYGTGKIGTGNRRALLDHGIFFRYLKDLIQISANLATNTRNYQLCLTNNVETMWSLAQTDENCLWGATWYQPAYAGEYSGSNNDEWASSIVISLEAQTASSTLLEMKASL